MASYKKTEGSFFTELESQYKSHYGVAQELFCNGLSCRLLCKRTLQGSILIPNVFTLLELKVVEEKLSI